MLSPIRRLAKSRPLVGWLSAISAAVALSFSAEANARSIIKMPGAHPDYSVELEPHLVLQWDRSPWGETGWGPGLRVNIPFLDNGPIPKINNNMAIGFGMDWVMFNDVCNWYWTRNRNRPDNWSDYDCNATELWFPVVLQWNFFLTDVISVFGEPGLAIERYSWDWDDAWCNRGVCHNSDVDLEPVFWGGARFLLGDTVSIIARIGTPSVTVGVSFLL